MKEGFSWKSIFINEEPIPNAEPINIPQTSNTFPSESVVQQPIAVNTNNPFIGEIIAVYDKGSESLNSPNFDFFEFYKSVISVGINNSQSYQMAYTMGAAMNSQLNKQMLLDKANFYIAEIEKVHKNFLNTGTAKSNEISLNISNQKKGLENSIAELENKITQLQKELIDAKAELQRVESGTSKEFVEIQQKLEANERAKERLIQSIKQVVSGINQYIK
jgi:uncharacterized small protein (DUF1192 family)